MPPTNLALTLGKKFNEQLDVSWEGAFFKRFEDTPGFAVHNLRASYDIDTGFLKEAKLRVGVDNLFDKQYQTHLATRPAPGRNIKVSLTAAF
jgi:hemoglobin/transferrin/lactoferrin receptor protein